MDSTQYWMGLFLRFGVPLGMTAVLAWMLRNLDERWRVEAGAEVSEPQQGEASSAECWNSRDCPDARRERGRAAQERGHACWQIRQALTGRLPEECLDCPVFMQSVLGLAA